MMGFVIAAAIVAVLGILIWLTLKAVDGSGLAGATAGVKRQKLTLKTPTKG